MGWFHRSSRRADNYLRGRDDLGPAAQILVSVACTIHGRADAGGPEGDECSECIEMEERAGWR